MAVRRSSVIWFVGFHLAAIAGILLFPFYRVGAAALFALIPFCLMHDWMHLYCPLCGGTRSVDALLRFRFSEAFRFHPLVPFFACVALVYYILAWVRLFRGKTLLAPIPKPLSVALTVAVVAFWVLRNLLLIAFGIDPTGDLLAFWN